MSRAKSRSGSITYLCELDDGTDNVQRYVTLSGDTEPAKGDRVVFGDVTPGDDDTPESKDVDTLVAADDVTEEHTGLPVVRTATLLQHNHADGSADDDENKE